MTTEELALYRRLKLDTGLSDKEVCKLVIGVVRMLMHDDPGLLELRLPQDDRPPPVAMAA